MKFRGPVLKKEYENLHIAFLSYCSKKTCETCALGTHTRKGIEECMDYCDANPIYAAKLMGYEVINDTTDMTDEEFLDNVRQAKVTNIPLEQEAKADRGKLEIDLVPRQIIRDIAEVRMYGTKKYHDPENWRKVELRRYINAMLRHTLAFLDDPDGVDEESGIPHYKHAECNWSFIAELMKKH